MSTVLRSARLMAGGPPVDVWATDGRIAAIRPSGGRPVGFEAGAYTEGDRPSGDRPIGLGAGADTEVDLAGARLSPGWVDLHTHVFGEIGIGDPDAIGVLAGVTALADAGSAGPPCVEDLWAQAAAARTDVYSFSYLESRGAAQIAGIPSGPGDLSAIPLGELIAAIERRPGFVRGIKFDGLADLGVAWVRAALALADLVGLPAMVHIGNFPNNHTVSVDYVRALLDALRPGDVVTHIYTGSPGGLCDTDGRVLPEALRAQERGVVMDLGYAYTGYAVATAGRLLHAGLAPDTVSSDLQVRTARQRVRSLASVMGRVLELGIGLEAVIEAVTAAPRRALGLPALSVEVGAPADLTAFRVSEEPEEYRDGTGASFVARHRFEVVTTVKGGQVITPDPEAVVHPQNLRWVVDLDGPVGPAPDPCVASVLEGLARLLEAVPVSGELAQGAFGALVASTGADRRHALRSLYGAVAGRTSGPQVGWMLADVAASHGGGPLAKRLRQVAASSL